MNANVGEVDNMAPTACAACRHQRKRCDQHCQLARYFPPSKTQDYFNCQNLFGANNFLKILNSVEDHERDKTAATLIYEAELWKKNPVQGGMARVRSLQEQIGEGEKELDAVNEHVSLFKNSHSEIDRLESQLDKISLEITPSLCVKEENSGEMNPPFNVEEENGGEMNSPSDVEEENGGKTSPPSCVEEENGGEMSPPPFNNN